MPHRPYRRDVPGGKNAVLFLHGIVGTPDHFLPLLPLLPEDCACSSLLLAGHGGSATLRQCEIYGSFVGAGHAPPATWRKRET